MIFDYWKDPLSTGKDKDYPVFLKEIDPEKKLYVIVSHHHKDHFSRRIFLWAERFKNINFIISSDTYKSVSYLFKEEGTYQGIKPPINAVHVLEPGETFIDETITIKAFESTDIGNSYGIIINDLKVFHAGDLNAWLWIDESSQQEVEESRNAFTRIIQTIKSDFPKFDIVMFPVDSRMGKEYWWGARYFVNNIETSLFIPMHFELVLSEDEKEQRRIDAAAFNLYARNDIGAYLQLASTRSRYISN